jgi:tetratricopeptide (TPR) repeat protein
MCNAAQVKGAPLTKVEDFLENLPITDTSAVLTEKLAELCDVQGKPESAIDFYQRALNLDPSPEQRIRIRLTLGQDLVAQNQIDEAIQNYKELLEESPAYPGRDSVSGKIAALEQKSTGAK